MSNTFQILDDQGNVINTIIAGIDFVEQHHPGRYREIPDNPLPAFYIITKVAFRFRLTDSEYVGILNAAKTDTEVQAWYETFNMVATIDLDSQRTKDGVANLVSKNLLTQARADEILTAPVQPNERA